MKSKNLPNHTPIHEGGIQMHLRIKAGDIPSYVLTPGDPGRVPTIGKCWDSYEELKQNREYKTAKGSYKGTELAACSTGIGGPSVEIAIVELTNVGADTFLRVGTCAALQDYIEPGDLVINTGALRLTGTADACVGKEYPAVANYEIVMALIEAAEKLGHRYHLGFTASVDSFYAGEVNPMPGGYWTSKMDHIIADLQAAKVTNFEMEAATLFVLANLFGLRAGCVCIVAANRITCKRDESPTGIIKVSETACEAMHILSKWDKEKKKSGKKYFYPSLWISKSE